MLVFVDSIVVPQIVDILLLLTVDTIVTLLIDCYCATPLLFVIIVVHDRCWWRCLLLVIVVVV